MFQNVIYYIKTIFRWVVRCKYCRGFGIQSPSAYSFVTQVVNCHHTYPIYEELDNLQNVHSKQLRKIGRLLYRITKFWQPKYVVMGDYDYAPFVYAGCQDTLVRMIDDYYFDDEVRQRVLVVLDLERLDGTNIDEELLQYGSDQLLLVILDIHKNKKHYQLWKKIISDERTGVTYDLFSCGIIFFDKSKYKQDFKINF